MVNRPLLSSPLLSSSLLSSPLFRLLAGALGLVFVSLVIGSRGRLGEIGYLGAAALLAVVAQSTWRRFDRPGNWAAASAVLGLTSAAVFAATELSDVTAEGGGGPAIIPVAWLFAATSWYTHRERIRTLPWVITLVQVSFTTLSALLFTLASARADDGARTLGYGVAATIGIAGGVMAVIGIAGRVRLELAKRAG